MSSFARACLCAVHALCVRAAYCLSQIGPDPCSSHLVYLVCTRAFALLIRGSNVSRIASLHSLE